MNSGKIHSAKKFKPARRYGLQTSLFKANVGLKRSYRPGQHGKALKRNTSYGIRKNAMKILQWCYGGPKLRISQLKRYFAEAGRRQGNTGENLIKILESRLDNLVYKMKLGSTLHQARQLVVHSHIMVNGKKVNKPSMLCKAGDVITVSAKAKDFVTVAESISDASRDVPDYIQISDDKLTGTYVRVPSNDEIPHLAHIDLNLVVEFLS